MLSKIFGYGLGAIFVAIFFAPVGVAGWLVYDRISVINSTEVIDAVITECQSHRNSGPNSKLSFGPVAETGSGLRIKGTFRLSRRSWCEMQVADNVKVRVSEKDPTKNRIYTFFQFWFLPFIFILISITVYPIGYYYKLRSKIK